MMTREQIERIADGCGVLVSFEEEGNGGFIVDSANVKYESLTDILEETFINTTMLDEYCNRTEIKDEITKKSNELKKYIRKQIAISRWKKMKR